MAGNYDNTAPRTYARIAVELWRSLLMSPVLEDSRPARGLDLGRFAAQTRAADHGCGL